MQSFIRGSTTEGDREQWTVERGDKDHSEIYMEFDVSGKDGKEDYGSHSLWEWWGRGDIKPQFTGMEGINESLKHR